MRAGRLDRLITIQRKSISYSASGEPQESWAALSSQRPASIAPVRGEERFSGEQWVAKEQVEFRTHWSAVIADLSPLDRIIYPAQAADSPDAPIERNIYDVLAVHEIGRREGLQIIAARRADA